MPLRKVALLPAAALLAVSLPAFSQLPAFKELKTGFPDGFSGADALRRELPPPPEAADPVAFLVYETDEEFPFESRAREAMELREAALRRAGLTTLGGRVVRKPNHRYTFVVEYLPKLDAGSAAPRAVLLRSYDSAAVYWRESDAEEALANASARIQGAGLAVVAGAVTEAGRDHSFTVEFVMPNKLRRSREYQARIERWQGGRFTFESGAEAAIGEFTARFNRAGVPVIRGKAVRLPDRDWAVVLEYVNRTNSSGSRPAYGFARYDSRESFTFEDDALEAGTARLGAFSRAGASVVHVFAKKTGHKWTFSVDFLVRTLYGRTGSVPALRVRIYQAEESFTFKSEAEEAMAEKSAAFTAAGFHVVGSETVKVGRGYSYILDYISKAERPRGDSPRRYRDRG